MTVSKKQGKKTEEIGRTPREILESLEGRELSCNGEEEYKRIVQQVVETEEQERLLEIRTNERLVREFYKIDSSQRLVDPFLINLLARDVNTQKNLITRINSRMFESAPEFKKRARSVQKGIDFLITGLNTCEGIVTQYERREKVRKRGLTGTKRRIEKDVGLFFDIFNNASLVNPIAAKEAKAWYKARFMSLLDKIPGENYKILESNSNIKIEFYDFLNAVATYEGLFGLFKEISESAYTEAMEAGNQVLALRNIIEERLGDVDLDAILAQVNTKIISEAMYLAKERDDVEKIKREHAGLLNDLRNLRGEKEKHAKVRRENILRITKSSQEIWHLIGKSIYANELERRACAVSPSQTLDFVTDTLGDNLAIIKYLLEKTEEKQPKVKEVIPAAIKRENKQLKDKNRKLIAQLGVTKKERIERVMKKIREKEQTIDPATFSMYKKLTKVKAAYQKYAADNEISTIEIPKINLQDAYALTAVLQNYNNVLTEIEKAAAERIVPAEKKAEKIWAGLIENLPKELRNKNIMIIRKNLVQLIEQTQKEVKKIRIANEESIPVILNDNRYVLEELIDRFVQSAGESQDKKYFNQVRKAVRGELVEEDPAFVYQQSTVALQLLESHINPIYEEIVSLDVIPEKQKEIAQKFGYDNFKDFRNEVKELIAGFENDESGMYSRAKKLFKGQKAGIRNKKSAVKKVKALKKKIKRFNISPNKQNERKQELVRNSIVSEISNYDDLRDWVIGTKKKLGNLDKGVSTGDAICDIANELIQGNVTSSCFDIADSKEYPTYSASQEYLNGIIYASDFVELDNQLAYFNNLKPILGEFHSGEELLKSVKGEIKRIKPFLTRISKVQKALDKEKQALTDSYLSPDSDK